MHLAAWECIRLKFNGGVSVGFSGGLLSHRFSAGSALLTRSGCVQLLRRKILDQTPFFFSASGPHLDGWFQPSGLFCPPASGWRTAAGRSAAFGSLPVVGFQLQRCYFLSVPSHAFLLSHLSEIRRKPGYQLAGLEFAPVVLACAVADKAFRHIALQLGTRTTG